MKTKVFSLLAALALVAECVWMWVGIYPTIVLDFWRGINLVLFILLSILIGGLAMIFFWIALSNEEIKDAK